MNIADKIASLLRSGGIAVKDLWQGGSTGHATFYSDDAARKAALIFMGAGFKVRGPVRTTDYAKDNKGSNLCPSVVTVYRVGFYLR